MALGLFQAIFVIFSRCSRKFPCCAVINLFSYLPFYWPYYKLCTFRIDMLKTGKPKLTVYQTETVSILSSFSWSPLWLVECEERRSLYAYKLEGKKVIKGEQSFPILSVKLFFYTSQSILLFCCIRTGAFTIIEDQSGEQQNLVYAVHAVVYVHRYSILKTPVQPPLSFSLSLSLLLNTDIRFSWQRW